MLGESHGQVSAMVGVRGQGQLLLLTSFTSIFVHQPASLSTTWKHVYSDLFNGLEVICMAIHQVLVVYPFCL